MTRELDNMIIHYTEKDVNYIEELLKFVNYHSREILNFLNITKLDKKVDVYLYDSLEKFRNLCKNRNIVDDNGNVPDWVCGIANRKSEINTLCLEEYRKTKGHEEGTILDLCHLVLHEFVHSAHNYAIKNDEDTFLYQNGKFKWLSEGMATTISHQYDNKELEFNASLGDMINGCHDYNNYHTMFVTILENYGRDYILELIHNSTKLAEATPRLYDEVNDIYNKGKSL